MDMTEVSYREMNSENDQVHFDVSPRESINESMCNRKRQTILVSAVVLVIVLACTVVLCLTLLKTGHSDRIETNISHNRKEKLLNYLHEVSDSKRYISGILCGYNIYSKLQNVSKITKVLPGVVSISLPKNTANSTEWKSLIEEVIFVWNKHHLVEIFWWNSSPLYDMDIFKFTHGNEVEKEEKWNELILEGSILNTKWKDQLDFVAPYLHTLINAGVVPILDILPAINFPIPFSIWTCRPGVNGSVMMYKMTQDYLKQKHNIISVIWTWSLYPSKWAPLKEYWPGGNYVDVVSLYMKYVTWEVTDEYQELVDLAGDRPMSMEFIFNVPSTQVLTAQPRWTWFTALFFNNVKYSVNEVQPTFNSISAINGGNITYFGNTN